MGNLLLDLPSELIQAILSHVEPHDLTRLAQSCRLLYAESSDDQLYLPLINRHLHRPITSPGTVATFRELFWALFPYWFLPKQRLFFGDSEPCGKLLIAVYNEAQSSIEAYTVAATRGPHSLGHWQANPDVLVHSFNPTVSLDAAQPVITITPNCVKSEAQCSDQSKEQALVRKSKYSKETLMETFHDHDGLFSSIMLCRELPPAAISTGTALWPPQLFPASDLHRVRNDSSNQYRSAGHFPTRYREVSEHSFRVRRWVEYSGRRSSSDNRSVGTPSGLAAALGFGMPLLAPNTSGMRFRLPQEIETYATLPEACYMPTAAKPWQGIWCGDYSGHGCEFLLITQPDKQDEKPLPQRMDWLGKWFRGGRRGSSSGESSGSEQSFVSALAELDTIDRDEKPQGPTGRLEAIKLTGDPNIPRGEYSFIAPDIGPHGLIRVADEPDFENARIVRSCGHIAGRGFRQDQYTPSQLIMISHDRLAQFWEGFGHISYFQRVDLEALTESRA